MEACCSKLAIKSDLRRRANEWPNISTFDSESAIGKIENGTKRRRGASKPVLIYIPRYLIPGDVGAIIRS